MELLKNHLALAIVTDGLGTCGTNVFLKKFNITEINRLVLGVESFESLPAAMIIAVRLFRAMEAALMMISISLERGLGRLEICLRNVVQILKLNISGRRSRSLMEGSLSATDTWTILYFTLSLCPPIKYRALYLVLPPKVELMVSKNRPGRTLAFLGTSSFLQENSKRSSLQ